VLNLATQDSDNPDLRDRGFIYWRLLSTDPEAAKSVVLSEKPLITDTTSLLDESLLNELIPHISTLASVYHKPPESFVTKLKGLAKDRLKAAREEEEESEYDNDEDGDSSHPVSSQPGHGAGGQPNLAKQPAPKGGNLLDLDLMDLASALPSTSAPAPTNNANVLGLFDMGPSNPVQQVQQVQKAIMLPADQGKGMQISGAFARRDGRLVLDLSFTNFTPSPMGNFVIQFDKNNFGLAPATTQLGVPTLQQGQTGDFTLPIATSATVSPSPPTNSLRMAVKNSLSNEVFFFQGLIPFYVLFTETGQLERSSYLSMWKSIPDANERSKDINIEAFTPDLDSLLRKLTSRNMFEIARRKVNDQDVVYMSVKTENSVYILLELSFRPGVRQCKASSKTASLEYIPLFEAALEALLNQ